MKIVAYYLLVLLAAAFGCSSDAGSRQKSSASFALKHPATSPVKEKIRYTALLTEGILGYPILSTGSNAYLLKNDNGLSMILTVRWMQ